MRMHLKKWDIGLDLEQSESQMATDVTDYADASGCRK